MFHHSNKRPTKSERGPRKEGCFCEGPDLAMLFWKNVMDFGIHTGKAIVSLMGFPERNVDDGALACEVSKEVLRVSQGLSGVIY